MPNISILEMTMKKRRALRYPLVLLLTCMTDIHASALDLSSLLIEGADLMENRSPTTHGDSGAQFTRLGAATPEITTTNIYFHTSAACNGGFLGSFQVNGFFIFVDNKTYYTSAESIYAAAQNAAINPALIQSFEIDYIGNGGDSYIKYCAPNVACNAGTTECIAAGHNQDPVNVEWGLALP